MHVRCTCKKCIKLLIHFASRSKKMNVTIDSLLSEQIVIYLSYSEAVNFFSTNKRLSKYLERDDIWFILALNRYGIDFNKIRNFALPNNSFCTERKSYRRGVLRIEKSISKVANLIDTCEDVDDVDFGNETYGLNTNIYFLSKFFNKYFGDSELVKDIIGTFVDDQVLNVILEILLFSKLKKSLEYIASYYKLHKKYQRCNTLSTCREFYSKWIFRYGYSHMKNASHHIPDILVELIIKYADIYKFGSVEEHIVNELITNEDYENIIILIRQFRLADDEALCQIIMFLHDKKLWWNKFMSAIEYHESKIHEKLKTIHTFTPSLLIDEVIIPYRTK